MPKESLRDRDFDWHRKYARQTHLLTQLVRCLLPRVLDHNRMARAPHMVSTTDDGHELRSALCDACDSRCGRATNAPCAAAPCDTPSHSGAPPHRTPLQWSNAAINSLLDLVDCPKDERDPLALKQAISTLQPELSSLKLKQRKAVQVALEAQLQAAARASLPSRLHVDAPAAPAKVEAPSRPRPPVPASATGPPRVGTEAGYEWTQSEAELTLTVPLPEGTSKSDIVLQMTPRFGPAQTLVLHARFWPLPLLCGELCGQVEASETMPSQYAESAAS